MATKSIKFITMIIASTNKTKIMVMAVATIECSLRIFSNIDNTNRSQAMGIISRINNRFSKDQMCTILDKRPISEECRIRIQVGLNL